MSIQSPWLFLSCFTRSGLDGGVPPKSSLPPIFWLLRFVYWKHRKKAIGMLKKAGFEMATGSSQDVHMMIFFFQVKNWDTGPPLDFCRKDLTGRGNRSSRGRGWAWEIRYFHSRSNSFSLALSSIPTLLVTQTPAHLTCAVEEGITVSPLIWQV